MKLLFNLVQNRILKCFSWLSFSETNNRRCLGIALCLNLGPLLPSLLQRGSILPTFNNSHLFLLLFPILPVLSLNSFISIFHYSILKPSILFIYHNKTLMEIACLFVLISVILYSVSK